MRKESHSDEKGMTDNTTELLSNSGEIVELKDMREATRASGWGEEPS
jgi:hypothetical protein